MSSDGAGPRPAIRAVDLRKTYRLGEVRATSLRELVNRGIAKLAGRVPPVDVNVVHALDGLSFDVSPGEVVGVVGPNGAGKTTLLKVLSRITTPTSGFVEIAGRVGSVLDVGLGFHPDLTGRENLRLGASMLGMSPAETQARMPEIMAFAGLDPFLDTSLKGFSSGMIMRLWFSLATHLDCDVLLVDEVLLVGDAAFQRRGMDRLCELAASGRTVLITTHHLDVIRQICDRVIQLERGRIVRTGSPEAVLAAYREETLPARPAELARRAAPAFEGLMRLGHLAIHSRIETASDRDAVDAIFKQALQQNPPSAERPPMPVDGSLRIERAAPGVVWPAVEDDGLALTEEAGVLSMTTDVIDARIDVRWRPWQATLTTRPGRVEPDAFRTHLSIVLHRMLLQLGGVYLHGAAVVFDGWAHVFIGEKGAGKSTAALALGRSGGIVLSDDHVLVERVDDGWQVSGCESLSRVTEEAEAFLFQAPLAVSSRDFGGTRKKEFVLGDHFPAAPHTPHPVAALYFPSVGRRLGLETISPQQTTIDLLDRTRRSFRPQDSAEISALLEFWTGFAAAVPAYCLELSPDLADLEGLPALLAR